MTLHGWHRGKKIIYRSNTFEVTHLCKRAFLLSCLPLLQDSLISLYSKTSGNLLVMIKLAQQLCDECTPLLISNAVQQRTRELDVIVLEGVAKARYALALAAEFMYKSAVEGMGPWNELQIRSELKTLFEGVRRMCYKSLSPVPRLYLLKQLVRRFGVESIHVLCGLKEFEWIVPPESRDKQVKLCTHTTYPECCIQNSVIQNYFVCKSKR